MGNLVQWRDARPTTEREILSTVSERYKDAESYLIPNNFKATPNDDGYIPNVMVLFKTVTDGKDKEISITCSSKLSKLLRNGDVTKNQLAGFPVCEAVSKDGEIFPQIQMPSGAGLISIGKFTQVEEYTVEVITADDLIKI